MFSTCTENKTGRIYCRECYGGRLRKQVGRKITRPMCKSCDGYGMVASDGKSVLKLKKCSN
jgi:hypothetical protein